MRCFAVLGALAVLALPAHVEAQRYRTVMRLNETSCDGPKMFFEFEDGACVKLDKNTGPFAPFLSGLPIAVSIKLRVVSGTPRQLTIELGTGCIALATTTVAEGSCGTLNIQLASLTMKVAVESITDVVPTPSPAVPTPDPGNPLQGHVTLANFRLAAGFDTDCNVMDPFNFEVENDKCVSLGNASSSGLPVNAVIYAHFTCYQEHLEYTLSLSSDCDPKAKWDGLPTDLPDAGVLVEHEACREDWASIGLDAPDNMRFITPLYAKYDECFESTPEPPTPMPTSLPSGMTYVPTLVPAPATPVPAPTTPVPGNAPAPVAPGSDDETDWVPIVLGVAAAVAAVALVGVIVYVVRSKSGHTVQGGSVNADVLVPMETKVTQGGR